TWRGLLMSEPFILRLRAKDFADTVVCRGNQVAAVIRVAGDLCPGTVWYAADVDGSGFPVPAAGPQPQLLGNSSVAALSTRRVGQFLSGVFVASNVDHPRFRGGGFDTEEPEEPIDLGDNGSNYERLIQSI